MIGIYYWKNKLNNKQYVGQSTNIIKRKNNHLSDWRKNKCPYKILYKAFTKYGIKNFEFGILEECSQEELNAKENYWIGKLNSYGYGYNMSKLYYSGASRRPEVRAKISKTLTGSKLKEETKIKIGLANKISMLGNDNGKYNGKKIISRIDNKLFNQVNEAAKYYGKSKSTIIRYLKGEITNKYKLEYFSEV